MARAQLGYKGLPCLKCGETDTVWVHINDGSFSCSQCEGDWDVEEARAFLSKWSLILDWVAKMPKGGD